MTYIEVTTLSGCLWPCSGEILDHHLSLLHNMRLGEIFCDYNFSDYSLLRFDKHKSYRNFNFSSVVKAMVQNVTETSVKCWKHLVLFVNIIGNQVNMK